MINKSIYNGVDLQLRTFKKIMRGYDPAEVHSFLEEIATKLDSLNFEVGVLKDKLRDKDIALSDFRERESALRDTVVTAQKITDGIKKQAEKSSMQIVTSAKLKADNIIRDAKRRIKNNIDEVHKFEEHKIRVTTELRVVLETQLKMLDKYEKNENQNESINLGVQ